MALINVLVTTIQHRWSVLMPKAVIEDPVAFPNAYLENPDPSGSVRVSEHVGLLGPLLT